MFSLWGPVCSRNSQPDSQVPEIFGAGCAIPCTPGPDTCLGLDTPRLGVTERLGGAILASIPGPVLFLILPGALASVAAVPSIWGGRPAFMAAGEQCKGREGVRAQRSPALPDPRDTGLGGSLSPCMPHARLSAPCSAAGSHGTDSLGRRCAAMVNASFLLGVSRWG